MMKLEIEQVKGMVRGLVMYWAVTELTIPTFMCMGMGDNYMA